MKANMIIDLDQEIENLMGLYSTGSQEKVLTKATALASLHPHSAKLLNIIASATFKLGKSINCLKHYDRALKIQPDLAEAHNNIGFVAGFMGNFPNALNHFKRAIILSAALLGTVLSRATSQSIDSAFQESLLVIFKETTFPDSSQALPTAEPSLP